MGKRYRRERNVSRREVLSAGGLALGCTLLSNRTSAAATTRQPAPAVDTDWRSPQYDVAQSGYSPDADPPTKRPVSKGRAVSAGYKAHAEPVIANGVLYFSAKSDEFDTVVSAVDMSGGQQGGWSYTHEGGTDEPGQVSIRGNTLYAICNRTLYAFDVGSGTVRWKKSNCGLFVVGDKRVYHGRREADDVTEPVRALDASTGDVKWAYDAGYGFAEIRPALVENSVCFSGESGVLSLARSDGSKQWKYSDDNSDDYTANASATISDGVLVAGGVQGIVALNPSNGVRLWRRQTNGYVNGIAIGEGYVAVGTSAGIAVFDTQSGKKQWTAANKSTNPPAIANGIAYFGAGRTIQARKLDNGKQRWSVRTDDGAISEISTILTGSHVAVAMHDGKIHFIRDENAAPNAVFSFSPSNPGAGQPVTFDASESSDPDGSITSYRWDFTTDGSTDKRGQKVSKTFAEEGSYPITLTVRDDNSGEATTKRTVEVASSAESESDSATESGSDSTDESEINSQPTDQQESDIGEESEVPARDETAEGDNNGSSNTGGGKSNQNSGGTLTGAGSTPHKLTRDTAENKETETPSASVNGMDWTVLIGGAAITTALASCLALLRNTELTNRQR